MGMRVLSPNVEGAEEGWKEGLGVGATVGSWLMSWSFVGVNDGVDDGAALVGKRVLRPKIVGMGDGCNVGLNDGSKVGINVGRSSVGVRVISPLIDGETDGT